MTTLAERFEAKVDRSGEHHIWTGSKRSDGSGQLKVNGRAVPARRVAWELANGELAPGADVRTCPDEKACVRVDHLSLRSQGPAKISSPRRKRSHGSGSVREVRAGVWEVSVTRGTWDDGTPRRFFDTVPADGRPAAERELAAFVAEVDSEAMPRQKRDWDITVHRAVDRYLDEHLIKEKGRAKRTIRGYRQVYTRWFRDEIGDRRLRDIDKATFDRVLGKMRDAGLSRSAMAEVRSLFAGLFRWAKDRSYVRRVPMGSDYELPKSKQVASRRPPPEVGELVLLLRTAVEVVPDIAPVMTFSATTGMRLGEAVVRRRTDVLWDRMELRVTKAADIDGTEKNVKNETERTIALDEATIQMLRQHCELMDQRAREHGVTVAADAFLFSIEHDCSRFMRDGYVSKRLGVLKEHLGIDEKRPETIKLQNRAFELFREGRRDHRPGRPGPSPKGALSYAEIGRRLGRSEKWAKDAIASAQRREKAAGLRLDFFDGSMRALRRFTSTELLDSGFNVSAVASRQGHSPDVLVNYYSRRRASADRKAAEHLGRIVHEGHSPTGDDMGVEV